MIQKVKDGIAYVLGLAILVLSALLFRKGRQNEALESELAREKANDAIKQNEADRQAAREHADALVDEYEKLRGDDR